MNEIIPIDRWKAFEAWLYEFGYRHQATELAAYETVIRAALESVNCAHDTLTQISSGEVKTIGLLMADINTARTILAAALPPDDSEGE